jgi:hypothetical protein
MFSISLRNVVTAVALTVTLGLAAVPAGAQPRDVYEPARVEAGWVTRGWLWLVETWAPGALPDGRTDRAQQKSLAGGEPAGTDSITPGVHSRAGAFDPNG